MFFNSKEKKDVFGQRAKQQKVWQKLRRLINNCSPHLTPDEMSLRTSERYVRCVPIMCVPIVSDQLAVGSSVFGVTHDFSDNGNSVIATRPIECDSDLICGFFQEEPLLLFGKLRRCALFGGPFYQLGIEFSEVVEAREYYNVLNDQIELLRSDANYI